MCAYYTAYKLENENKISFKKKGIMEKVPLVLSMLGITQDWFLY